MHLAELSGRRFLHAFDDPDIIAGQGTVALELLPHRPDVVFIPIGGGGLAAGMGLVLREHGIRVIGVQVDGVDAMHQVLAGRLVSTAPLPTLADGVRVAEPGHLTRRICQRVLEDIVVVQEAQVKRAMVRLATRENLVADGAGALAGAGLSAAAGQRKMAVISGGNVEPTLFARLLTSVAASQDRVLDPVASRPAVTLQSHRSQSQEYCVTVA